MHTFATPKSSTEMNRKAFFTYIALTLATINPKVSAQETYTIDSVSVTAARVPIALHQSARIVTLMDSVAIASSPAENVNDLLKYALGVDVRQRGAMGMQTDISMRGGTYNQIAVLLNGINITDPQTGHNSVDFPVNLTDIDHIEVLEGPAARVYGTSSLVGAINIVTRKNSDTSAAANIEGGSFGYANVNLSAALGGKKGSNTLSAGYSRSDGFNRNSEGGLNSDFASFKAFYQGNHDFGSRDLQWQAGLSNKDFGSSTFYSSRFDDQFEHTFKTFAAIKSEGKGRLHFTPAIYWNHGEDRFELFRGAPDKYPFNYHKTNVFGANLNFHTDWKLGRTAFGAEARHEAIRSTNLGEKLEDPSGVYVCGLGRTAYNVFLEHNVIFGPLSASAGVTAVYNTGNKEGVKFFPGADVSLRIGEAMRLYGSWNTSYRMPTFTELYYSVGGHLADPNLKAEKLHAIEGGVKYSARGIRAIAAVYYNKGFDMIDWIKEKGAGDDAPWTSVNHTRLNTFGQELTLHVSPAQLLVRKDFFLQDVSLGYSHISQSKKEDAGWRSMYSMEYIRHKLIAQADFAIAKGLTANLSWRYIDRATDSELIKPYHVLDAKLSYLLREKFNFYLRANNLLGYKYFDFGDIPQPGLWLMGGATFRIF